jgi:hypothetical protein
MRKLLERRVADTDLESSANSGFSLSVGMIETRLALPQRSPSPLSVPESAAHRHEPRQRVRHRLVSVVVGVDTDDRRNGFHHITNDLFNFVRQRSAIRIAQDNPPRAFFVSGLSAGQRIFRISLVTIKEMFAVERTSLPFAFAARTLSRIEEGSPRPSSPERL